MSEVLTKIELPPKYYLAHFQELRNVLLNQYGPFFQDSHHQFFVDFDSLSEDAQCLYLRLTNRRGRFFHVHTLKYQEITSFETALEELHLKQFARSVDQADWHELLDYLPKARLVEIALTKNIEIKKSWSRDRLRDAIAETEFQHLPEIVVQGKMEELSYLLFLYFGKIQDNLSLYTLRDLGVRKVSKQKESYKVRFESRDEAISHYFYSRLAEDYSVNTAISSWPEALNDEAKELRENIILSIAEDFKKEEKLTEALRALRFSASHPGREKRIRLLYQLDRKDEALAELHQVLESPYSDVEFLFAEDFLGRKFHSRKRSILTETLRNAHKIHIDESFFRHPEMGIQAHFKALGIESFHVENYLWNSLFGLMFWEELFESEKTGLYNEFERRPRDLQSSRFFELHREEIEEKLGQLSVDYFQRKAEEKKDIQNGVFGWHESLLPQIEVFLAHADPRSVKEMLLHMAKDFNKRSTGFPDLLAIVNGKARFFEIKAEGDSIKQTQLLQMIALGRAGFEVEVLQVAYSYNPDQVYVVVDIETTGGSLPYHRITELGAVKVRNGEIIDKYQTLVNPQRFISREIQGLTGISNEMVKDAPKFSEVAEAFAEFTKDAIFVAHNVNFDYSFIQAEFAKLDQRFVRPYICTKAGMKKHYPGLESYGLKKLTSHFEIPLITHHRALCDAEAAAGLLFLINQKRAADSSAEKSPDALDLSSSSVTK